MVSLDNRIKYHFIDSSGIEYCDEQCSPILIVSEDSRTQEEVTWRYDFVEIGQQFLFTEKLKEAAAA